MQIIVVEFLTIKNIQISNEPFVHYFGKQTIRTSCPKLKAICGATIIEATKERQLMVATSENPGAGFGNLSVCL